MPRDASWISTITGASSASASARTEADAGVAVQAALPGTVVAPRFARDDSHFAVRPAGEEVAG